MRRRKVIISILVIVGLSAVWFLGVDWSWFMEECKDCGWQRHEYQYRLFTIPVHETADEEETFIQLIAEDLGAPCAHTALYRLHRHRWWGLCICARPCINGITGFIWDGRQDYEKTYTAKVKAMAVDDPSLPEEFRQRVLYEHDWAYFKKFKEKLDEYKID